jgi:hypothetical protein
MNDEKEMEEIEWPIAKSKFSRRSIKTASQDWKVK